MARVRGCLASQDSPASTPVEVVESITPLAAKLPGSIVYRDKMFPHAREAEDSVAYTPAPVPQEKVELVFRAITKGAAAPACRYTRTPLAVKLSWLEAWIWEGFSKERKVITHKREGIRGNPGENTQGLCPCIEYAVGLPTLGLPIE
jgi:hypothetical protein